MTRFSVILIAVIVLGCFAGYEVASRDLLQQVFLARKFTHRLAECLCAGLVLLVQMFFSPMAVLCVIPPVVAALYVLGALGLNQLFKRRESNLCTDDHRKKVRETALCTFISCLAFVGGGLVVLQAVACSPNIAAQLYISGARRAVCAGISMGVNSLLVAALIHYLLVLRMHPSDDDNPSRELLKLRKELGAPNHI